MTLTIPGYDPETYEGLVSLHNTTFDLSDPKYKIVTKEAYTTYIPKILSGQFQIKRAQHLLVDEISEEVILSGIFEFEAIVNGTPITVTNGRFDVGVGNTNFYRY
jgi:hypothetical protein